jgi:DNA-binding transcriptional LysR family regulator
MWEAVELREIRVFLKLTEELHFGHTAERLSISQSRVSQTIRELETKLGGRLIDRTSRRVALTPFGERLLHELRGPSEALNHALANARDRSGKIDGELRISLLTPLAQGRYLPEIIATFNRLYPDCAIAIKDELNPHALESIQKGDSDLLISWLPVQASDICCGPVLASEQRVLAVARDHPLAAREYVTMEDVADYVVADMQWVFPPEISDAFAPQLAANGRAIRRIPLNLGISGLASYITRREIVHPTVACYAKHFGDPAIVAVPLRGLPPIRSAALWHSDRSTDPRITAFVEVARQILPSELYQAGNDNVASEDRDQLVASRNHSGPTPTSHG